MAPMTKASKTTKAPQHTRSQTLGESPIPSPGAVSESPPRDSPGSLMLEEDDQAASDPLEDIDIRRHIYSLPTKADLEKFADRVEKALKEDIAQLKADTTHLGGRIESLEQR